MITGPILIVDDRPAQTKKERLVEIYKNNVYRDIELYTYKHVEGSGIQDVKVGNAVSADNAENMDGMILARNVEFRDAQLRRKIRFAISKEDKEYANDEITQEDHKYRYPLLLPEAFNDNTLRSLAEYIHRFLVFGAIYDWYMMLGMSAQAAGYGSQLEDIEQAISDMLIAPSVAKKPLQPFGPAEKIR